MGGGRIYVASPSLSLLDLENEQRIEEKVKSPPKSQLPTGMVYMLPLLRRLKRKPGRDGCEFKASWGYLVSSKLPLGYRPELHSTD